MDIYKSYNENFKNIFQKILDRSADKELISHYKFIRSRRNPDRYHVFSQEKKLMLTILLHFEDQATLKFEIVEERPGVILIHYGLLFSQSDGVILEEKLMALIAEVHERNKIFLEVLNDLIRRKLVRKYREISFKKYPIVYELHLADIKKILNIVPNFSSMYSGKHKYSSSKNTYYLKFLSVVDKASFREELEGLVQENRRGFLLEKQFLEDFKKKEKRSDFFIIEKTTEKEEKQKYGDFCFTFLGPHKIYVDLKSSLTGVLDFIQKEGLKRKKDGYVIPLNYQKCIDNEVQVKIILDYLRLLAKNPEIIKSLDSHEFLEHQNERLFS